MDTHPPRFASRPFDTYLRRERRVRHGQTAAPAMLAHSLDISRRSGREREAIGVIAIPARPSTRPKPRSSYRGCTLLLVDALNDAHAGGKTSSKPLFLSLCSFFFCRDFSFPVFFAVIYRRRLVCNNQLKQQVSTRFPDSQLLL